MLNTNYAGLVTAFISLSDSPVGYIIHILKQKATPASWLAEVMCVSSLGGTLNNEGSPLSSLHKLYYWRIIIYEIYKIIKYTCIGDTNNLIMKNRNMIYIGCIW